MFHMVESVSAGFAPASIKSKNERNAHKAMMLTFLLLVTIAKPFCENVNLGILEFLFFNLSIYLFFEITLET